jgi:hypothetical protein
VEEAEESESAEEEIMPEFGSEEDEDEDEQDEDEDEDEEDEDEEDEDEDEDEEAPDEEAPDEEGWTKFKAAKVVWPPNADAAPLEIAMGCLLNLFRLGALKSLSGTTMEAEVKMWKSLGQEWTRLLPAKAQSMRSKCFALL